MPLSDKPSLSLGRRGLIGGAVGTSALIVTRPLYAQQPAQPAAGQPSAVINVTNARAAPIPIAVTTFTGTDPASSSLGQQITQIITADLTGSGLFKEIPPAAFIQEPPGATTPAFQNWAGIGAHALVTGDAQVSGSTLHVDFRLWDVLPQKQLQGTAYTTTTANVRRIAHIIADAIYQDLLGEKGYFDTRIAYVSAVGPRGREVRRLAIMDQDGANQRLLTNGAWTVLTPRFSPVRDRLAFMSYANNLPRVYLYDLSTGRQSVLGDFRGMTFGPRFSPDGHSVIMARAHGSGSEIVVVDIASRAARTLTHSESIDVSPCYSPDGTQITFASDRGGSQQLYVMAADGSGAKRISFGSGKYGTPVWSPRGDLIAFTRYGGDLADFNIGVMHPDGSGERIIAQGWDVEGPTFAPNGRVMMYFSQTRASAGGRGFSSVLKSIDITGFGGHTVPAAGNASDPAWSPLGG